MCWRGAVRAESCCFRAAKAKVPRQLRVEGALSGPLAAFSPNFAFSLGYGGENHLTPCPGVGALDTDVLLSGSPPWPSLLATLQAWSQWAGGWKPPTAHPGQAGIDSSLVPATPFLPQPVPAPSAANEPQQDLAHKLLVGAGMKSNPGGIGLPSCLRAMCCQLWCRGGKPAPDPGPSQCPGAILAAA